MVLVDIRCHRDVSHQLDLHRDVFEHAQDFGVAVNESVDVVGQADLVGELLDEVARATQLMARHARKEVMHRLVLQTAVKEVQPRWAGDVHGRAKHLRRE